MIESHDYGTGSTCSRYRFLSLQTQCWGTIMTHFFGSTEVI